MRIQDNSSKTRLSILFYSFMWDALKIAEQTTYLLTVFRDPLQPESWLERTEQPDPPPGTPESKKGKVTN
jgi:hypothetical protein